MALSATVSGNNVQLAFPTQPGAVYRVYYRTDLANGNWTLLATLPGNGQVQTFTDPAGPGARFYKVTAP